MSAPKHDDRDLEAHSDVDEKVPSGATTPNLHNNNHSDAPANDAASDYRNENVHKTNGVAMMEAISTAAHASDNSGRWMLYSIAASMFAMYWVSLRPLIAPYLAAAVREDLQQAFSRLSGSHSAATPACSPLPLVLFADTAS